MVDRNFMLLFFSQLRILPSGVLLLSRIRLTQTAVLMVQQRFEVLHIRLFIRCFEVRRGMVTKPARIMRTLEGIICPREL